MRVLFLNDLHDPRIGSSIRQMYQHAARLRELGHEATVVSTTPQRQAVGRTSILGSEVHLVHSDYPLRFRAWVGLRNQRVLGPLREILARERPDVVHKPRRQKSVQEPGHQGPVAHLSHRIWQKTITLALALAKGLLKRR